MSEQKYTFVLRRMVQFQAAVIKRPDFEKPFERQEPRTNIDQRMAEQKTIDETLLKVGSSAAITSVDLASLEGKITDGDVLIDGCLRIARELARQGKEEAAADALAIARRTALQSSTDWMISRTKDVWNVAVELGYAMEMERADALACAERRGEPPAPVEQEKTRAPEELKWPADRRVEPDEQDEYWKCGNYYGDLHLPPRRRRRK